MIHEGSADADTPADDLKGLRCAWTNRAPSGALSVGAKRFARRVWLRLFARRPFWHNRAYDGRFLCLPDTARPGHGYLIWDERIVLPVTHAAAGPGPGNLAGGCNIVASGPSILEIRDRQRLLDRFSVAVNGAHAAVPRGDRQFDLYVVTDLQFIKGRWDLFRAGLDAAKTFAANHRVFVEILQRDPQLLVGRRLVLFTDLSQPYLGPRNDKAAWRRLPGVMLAPNGLGFSLNPAVGVFPGDTVIYPCLQLLCGWGFRQIFVFGMDLTGAQRSYREDYPAPSFLVRDYASAVLPSFELAARAASAWGITIWNCSPASVLPEHVLPKLAPEPALNGAAAVNWIQGSFSKQPRTGRPPTGGSARRATG